MKKVYEEFENINWSVLYEKLQQLKKKSGGWFSFDVCLLENVHSMRDEYYFNISVADIYSERFKTWRELLEFIDLLLSLNNVEKDYVPHLIKINECKAEEIKNKIERNKAENKRLDEEQKNISEKIKELKQKS